MFFGFLQLLKTFFSIFSFKLTEPTNALAAATCYSHAPNLIGLFRNPQRSSCHYALTQALLEIKNPDKQAQSESLQNKWLYLTKWNISTNFRKRSIWCVKVNSVSSSNSQWTSWSKYFLFHRGPLLVVGRWSRTQSETFQRLVYGNRLPVKGWRGTWTCLCFPHCDYKSAHPCSPRWRRVTPGAPDDMEN